MKRAWLVIALLASLAVPRAARADHERPETEHLVLAGAAMALPTYWINLVIHESTHALVAKVYGATITRFQLLPGKHPRTGDFYFGYVEYRGHLTVRQKTVFFLSPKMVDVAMLSGYAALVFTDSLPHDHWGKLPLVVLATGFFLDLSKDLLGGIWSETDVDKALARNGITTWRGRLPWRLLHVAVSAAAGYVVYRGYRDLFEDPEPAATPRLSAPLLHLSF